MIDVDPAYETDFYLNAENSSAFIVSLDNWGVFRWAKALGGSLGSIYTPDLVVNSSGVYVSGNFSSEPDFNPDGPVYKYVSNGSDDIFLEKLSLNTGAMQWVRRIGGVEKDYNASIALDPYGNVILTGYFKGLVDFNPGGGNYIYNLDSSSPVPHQQLYVLRLNQNGLF